MQRTGFVLMLAVCLGASLAWGGDVTLEPSAGIRMDEGAGNAVLLLEFNLPEALADARIIRAILRLDAACENDTPHRVWAHPVSEDWPGGESLSNWWSEERETFRSGDVRLYEDFDCSGEQIALDVAKWIRACRDSETAPRLAVRWDSDLTGNATALSLAPELKIIYRPQ